MRNHYFSVQVPKKREATQQLVCAHGELYVMFTSIQFFYFLSFFLLVGWGPRMGCYPQDDQNGKSSLLQDELGHVDGELSARLGLKETGSCCKAECYSHYTIQVPVQKKVWW